jgi:copper transport protein
MTVQVASAVAATGAAAAAIALVDRSAAAFALVPALVLLAAPTFAGHSLDPGRSWLAVPLDLLHVVAAALWVGGLFALVVAVPRANAGAKVVAAATRRFSRLALAAVVVLAATGAGRAFVELSSVAQLWTTGYGQALLVKTALFLCALGVAAVSRSRVSRAVERVRASATVELVLVAGIVVAVAVLTSLRPGRG